MKEWTESDERAACEALQRILELELAGVLRFVHYGLMVTGPHRLPIVEFFKAQADESLLHAGRAGEILTGLGGHPSMKVAAIEESGEHNVEAILSESLEHERTAVGAYRRLLEIVADKSVFLEEFARSMVATEEEHQIELRKMLRDLKS